MRQISKFADEGQAVQVCARRAALLTLMSLSLSSLGGRLALLLFGELFLLLGQFPLAVLVEELGAVLVHLRSLIVDLRRAQVSGNLPVFVVLMLSVALAHIPSVTAGRHGSFAVWAPRPAELAGNRFRAPSI